MAQERLLTLEEEQKNTTPELGQFQDILAPYILGKDPQELRFKVTSRLETIHTIRKKYNLDDHLTLNLETALTLVDDNLFDQVITETHQEGKTLKTARHEMGHANVASALGWNVSYVSVIPSASYLGITYSNPPENLSRYDYFLQSAAISYGGIIAAQMLGDEPRGGGSDMASAAAMAKVINHYYPQITENAFLNHAQTLAHSALRRTGTSSMEKQAQVLLYKKEAA
jgi:hypothetical protein